MKNEYEKSNAELARVIHALIAKYYKHARYNSKVDESVTETPDDTTMFDSQASQGTREEGGINMEMKHNVNEEDDGNNEDSENEEEENSIER